MSSTLILIRSLYDSLSQTQRQLADYILDNGEEVPFLTVHELAHNADVSMATISRFAKELNFDGYKEFKTQLGKDSLPSVTGFFQAITSSDSDEDIIDKVFRGNITSLEDTLKIVDHDELLRVARTLAISERIVFLGIGGSGNIARDAALRMSQLDIQAEAHSDSYEMLIQAHRMKKNEVAFGISHTGRSAITVQAMELASAGGATTIGMSNSLKSPLHETSDSFLCTSFPESQLESASLSSLIAQMCVIDALYLLVARYKAVSLKKMYQLNDCIEQTLRVPPK